MEPPKDAIATAGGTIWVEDGIVIERTHGVPSSAKSVKEAFGVFRDLTEGSPRPFLLDARRWWGGGPGAWETGITSARATFSAMAMLIDPESGASPGPFPEIINRLMFPFQVFTDEVEALVFLRGYLPSE